MFKNNVVFGDIILEAGSMGQNEKRVGKGVPYKRARWAKKAKLLGL